MVEFKVRLAVDQTGNCIPVVVDLRGAFRTVSDGNYMFPIGYYPKRLVDTGVSEAAARQACMRADLAFELNNLIGKPNSAQALHHADQVVFTAPYLRGGYQSRGDAHPKVPNVQEAFAKKAFRGDVRLTFKRTIDSLVTDAMLAKGPMP
ncbi:hypothetical protein DFH28DRAFT_1121807 [Melampsora americana]|nr:hypothetical protein DFH28DRAFT_1121807 [Melampsora americana]